jgi:hypothetical protein
VNNEIIRMDNDPPPALPDRLASEQIIVSAPMSYHGSAARIWKITRRGGDATWAVLAIGALSALLIACAWMAVTCWYLFFGLLLIPYRLVRRGQRKRKLEEARHRELLAATSRQDSES